MLWDLFQFLPLEFGLLGFLELSLTLDVAEQITL